MSIKDKKWLKMFCLSLLGLCLYLFDTGSDTAVGNRLIQNCHIRFGSAVLCLVYVLPGLFIFLSAVINPELDDNCIVQFSIGLLFGVFFVPFAALALMANLIKMNDYWLDVSKE